MTLQCEHNGARKSKDDLHEDNIQVGQVHQETKDDLTKDNIRVGQVHQETENDLNSVDDLIVLRYERCVNLDGKCARHHTTLCEKRVREKYWAEGENGLCRYKYRVKKVLVCSETKFQIPGGGTIKTTQGERNNMHTKSESSGGKKRSRP